jgi:hypothetical protein
MSCCSSKPKFPRSFGETTFVVEEFGVVEIGTFDLGRGSLSDGEKFLDGGLASADPEAFVAFPQSFSDGTGQGLAGGFGNRLGQTVGFRVFDIQAHGVSTLL